MDEQTTPQNFWRTVRKRWLPVTAVAVLVVITSVLAVTGLEPREPEHAGPVAPGFALRDQRGRMTSLAQFRGRVVLLTFIDPECSQICPLTTQSMLDVLKLLGPAAASHVELLGVNVNAAKTKITDVAAYTRLHHLQGRWRFLTGSPAQLKNVWRDYHVYVATTPTAMSNTRLSFISSTVRAMSAPPTPRP
jgi:cytochrome oxidase Cu insertion factor (SCO1/SenC/PrrC family)